MHAMNIHTQYRRHPHVLAARVDDELVMTSMQAGNYYGIGGIGTLVWELLAEPRSIAELVEAVVADYDVERNQCTADLAGFLDRLVDLDLVQPLPARD